MKRVPSGKHGRARKRRRAAPPSILIGLPADSWRIIFALAGVDIFKFMRLFPCISKDYGGFRSQTCAWPHFWVEDKGDAGAWTPPPQAHITTATVQCMRVVPHLPHLRTLRIGNADIMDVDMDIMKGLSLRSFTSAGCIYVGDPTLVLLEGMPLEFLSVCGRGTSDQGVRALKGMPLTSLSISATSITNEGVEHLAGMPLQVLDLFYNDISGETLEHLSLQSLRHLDLSLTRMTDQSMEAVYRMQNLTFLDVSNTCVTADGLKGLGRLKRLRYLNLSSLNLNDGALRNLYGMTSLRALSVTGNPVTQTGIAALISLLKGLRILDLSLTTTPRCIRRLCAWDSKGVALSAEYLEDYVCTWGAGAPQLVRKRFSDARHIPGHNLSYSLEM